MIGDFLAALVSSLFSGPTPSEDAAERWSRRPIWLRVLFVLAVFAPIIALAVWASTL